MIDKLLEYAEPEPNTGCWLWTGGTTNSGYGSLWVETESGRKKVGAHRIAYQCVYGSIPPKMTIDHRCKIKRCVNPSHLRLLSHRENILLADRGVISENMAKLTAPCGHPYTVRWGNALRCLPCSQTYMRTWRANRGITQRCAQTTLNSDEMGGDARDVHRGSPMGGEEITRDGSIKVKRNDS